MSGREDDIESRIISDVESNTGDDFDAGTETSAEPSTDDGRNSSAEPTDNRQRSNTKQPEPKRDAKQPKLGKDGKPEQQQPRRDDKGNIVDEKGNVIAAKGAERRLHYQAERLKDHNKNLTNENAQLRQQLQQTHALGGLPTQYGLDSNDVPEALRIAGVMKRDPAGGARMALEYAISQGADLNQIVTGQNLQNISLGAQRRMMDEYNRPQMEERARQQQAQKVRADVTRFLATYPEAEVHQQDIARMVPEVVKRAEAEGRSIDPYTAGEIALRTLQNWIMQNQLDPDRPIQDQIDERASQQQMQRPNGQQHNQRRDVRSPQPRQQAPMPNGSRGVSMQPSRSGSLPAGTSSDAIVRQAMLDNGYKFGT